mmetsp:Transcript_15574/g.35910  ORF Transcript_15574/g.35910 Transcript_15574/m.35910 type:complete len:165 (-) Transcript_15574:68-562(-)
MCHDAKLWICLNAIGTQNGFCLQNDCTARNARSTIFAIVIRHPLQNRPVQEDPIPSDPATIRTISADNFCTISDPKNSMNGIWDICIPSSLIGWEIPFDDSSCCFDDGCFTNMCSDFRYLSDLTTQHALVLVLAVPFRLSDSDMGWPLVCCDVLHFTDRCCVLR